MGSDTHAPETPTLLHTKLHRPRLADDVITRSHLLERLNRGFNRRATLISAPAGFGKTTLLVQWLDQAPYQAAWLSLDGGDNDLVVFLSYFIAAIQNLFPEACSTTHSLLAAPQTPPLDYLTTDLINDIHKLPDAFLLVLDDYHIIDHQDVHQLVTALMQHGPPQLHLVIATRQDPPISVARLRASQKITEIRGEDVRFTTEEVQSYLQLCPGVQASPETVRVLSERTEGWAVGLRLACLALRDQEDTTSFLETFEGTDRYIMEYLVDEVLSHQPGPVQTFLLRTSILDRFCGPLCDAVLDERRETKDEGKATAGLENSSLVDRHSSQSEDILASLERTNLFVVSLDQKGEWYRYHHLFRDLLRHRLKQHYSPAEISRMQARAGAWFAENGLVDEALDRFLAAGDRSAAVALVTRHRTEMLNQARWSRLERWTRRFSPDIIDQHPDMLMLKTWLLYHHARYAELPASLERLEAGLARVAMAPGRVDQLQGEMDALRSLLACFAVDAKATIVYAQGSLEKTRPDLWIVRSLARLTLALALQMRGDLRDAYAAIYDGFTQEEVSDPAFKATLLLTACFVYWMAADLQGLAQAAVQCIAQSQDAESPEIGKYGHYHLGSARYQHNDLAGAQRHFSTVCQQLYRNYGDCLVYGTCGLALTHQAQGHPEEARAAARSAVDFMLETGNTTLLAEAQALQAELALMQGKIAAASQWAAQLDPVPPLSPVYGFFSPHLTLVKIWLAQDTPASRGQAADLLGQLQAFFESTHNNRFLIETLALQALLQDRQGERETALELLKQAVALAEPGGFIRLFVDLGLPMARLLVALHRRDVAPEYIAHILAAFGTKDDVDAKSSSLVASSLAHGPSSSPVLSKAEGLIEPLTPRELEVLALLDRHLTNQEISEELVVSPSTVKTHTLNIYRKLEVHGRKQAVARAKELGMLP